MQDTRVLVPVEEAFLVSTDYFEEAARDARILADKISLEDYENLKKYWRNKRYFLIASMIRRYGLEFKGLTYLENLMEELLKIRGR